MNIKLDVHKIQTAKESSFMRQAKFTKALTIALPPEVYDDLKVKSDARKISMAELVRDILSETVLLSLYRDENISKSKLNGKDKTNE